MSAEKIQREDGRILVTLRELHRGEKTTITGWEPSREDLGLNRAGPYRVDGVELVEEEPVYYDDQDPEDENTYPRGYTEVVLAFDDEDALDNARQRLRDKATERFEWGASDADEVQSFAGRIPSPFEVEG